MRIASSSRSVPSASALAVYSGGLETHLHMALGGEIVDLVRLGFLHDADQVGRIGHVAVMQEKLRLALVRVLIEVVDAGRIERRRAPLDAVNHIALLSSSSAR